MDTKSPQIYKRKVCRNIYTCPKGSTCPTSDTCPQVKNHISTNTNTCPQVPNKPTDICPVLISKPDNTCPVPNPIPDDTCPPTNCNTQDTCSHLKIGPWSKRLISAVNSVGKITRRYSSADILKMRHNAEKSKFEI